MKVLYIISTPGQHSGKGGHYYSLKATIEGIKKKVDCTIIVIGARESLVINQIECKKYNLLYKQLSIFTLIQLIKDAKRIVDYEKIDIIHSFDEGAFFFGSMLSNICKKNHIHTKCGGGNPRISFPKVNNLILYSQENYSYYYNSKRFKNVNIHYIPNRIVPIEQDLLRINRLKLKIDATYKIFLLISRIDKYKKSTIMQTIDLVNKLNDDGIKSTLLIIGALQDLDVYNEMKSKLNKNIQIIMDDENTINASQLIDIADFVVGSGRSFMEAASRQKIMLCPSSNSKYPLLITKDNFHEAFNKNFSHRLCISENDLNENYAKILQAASDPNYGKIIATYIKEAYDEYFDINAKIDTFYEIYKDTEWKKCYNLFDSIISLYIIFSSSKSLKK